MVKVTIIGGGNLGVKVAGELAYHGHEVRVYDRDQEALDKAQLRIQEDQKMLRKDGILENISSMGQLLYMSRLEDAVKSSDFIFESVPEDLSLKQDLFEKISQCCKQDAIIATSALNCSCDDIVIRTSNKQRCLGVRFLFPVYCIPEVELTASKYTSVETLEKVRLFLSGMGKIAFLRSGSDPLVLSDEQRENKRNDFIKNSQLTVKNREKLKFLVPDLLNNQVLPNGIKFHLEARTRDKGCVVCMDDERNCVLYPCRHLCTCCTCGFILLKRQDACPMCRVPISSVFKVFNS